jgi:hypothetical protein
MPYCPKCGEEVGRDARFCPYCGARLKEIPAKEGRVGELQVERINIPYPEAEQCQLELETGAAGRVNLNPDGEDRFVEGTIEYDHPDWAPRIEIQGDLIRISQKERIERRIFHNPINRWDINLGDRKPFTLKLRTGLSLGNWELGGLPITDLDVKTGVSDNEISFKEFNPAQMRRFELSAGLGDVKLEGLLNANCEYVRVGGGLGGLLLEFTGKEMDRDATVRVEGGIGSIRVLVEEGVRAQASVRGISSVNARGTFTKVRGSLMEGEYSNHAFKTQEGPRLYLEISQGLGGIILETVPS